MIGFSLVHGGGALLLLAPVALLLWLVVVAATIAKGLIRRRRIAPSVWAHFSAAVVVGAVLLVPYSAWQWLFAGRIARAPRVGEFVTYAAATGDLRTVKALLSRGVSVNVTNRSGQTALHAAAVRNQAEVIRLLISKGARLDVLNRYGDSPLEEAASMNSAAAMQLLESRGAHRIRGTEAQHNEATSAIVKEDMEEMDRARRRAPAN